MNVNYTAMDDLASKSFKGLGLMFIHPLKGTNIQEMIQEITPYGYDESTADGIARAIYQAFGKSKKMTIEQHQQFLVEQGVQIENAQNITAGMFLLKDMVQEKQPENLVQENATYQPKIGKIVLGLILFVGGIVLSSGTNAIFYGAIIVGFFMMINGFLGGSD